MVKGLEHYLLALTIVLSLYRNLPYLLKLSSLELAGDEDLLKINLALADLHTSIMNETWDFDFSSVRKSQQTHVFQFTNHFWPRRSLESSRKTNFCSMSVSTILSW